MQSSNDLLLKAIQDISTELSESSFMTQTARSWDMPKSRTNIFLRLLRRFKARLLILRLAWKSRNLFLPKS